MAAPQVNREESAQLASETNEEKELRHRLVAARRARPVIIVRRGATALAPENTVEACAAAMDYGADGCLVDIRRTRDGILVLFSDEALDRLTLGFGPLNQVSYRELLALESQQAFGRPVSGQIPTFTALLNLARRRAMLLHLEVRGPGLDEEVARLLDAADAWDHLVAVSSVSGPWLSQHARSSSLPYKSDLSGEYRRDVDPDSVQAALALPGWMILVDDPRVAVRSLRREAYRPEPLHTSIHVSLGSPLATPGETNVAIAVDHIASLARRFRSASVDQLARLCDARFPEAGEAGDDDAFQRACAMRILDRAWAARRLGEMGSKSSRVVKLLEGLVARPSTHPDPDFEGLDAAIAARALGELGATESVSVLIEAFKRAGPGVGGAARAESGQAYPASSDSRVRPHVLAALGDLRCAAAKKFLLEYVNLDDLHARRWGPPRFEEAVRALLRQRMGWDETAALLRSGNPAIRGTAVMECIDQITEERRMALRAAAPWALELPRSKRPIVSRTIEWH